MRPKGVGSWRCWHRVLVGPQRLEDVLAQHDPSRGHRAWGLLQTIQSDLRGPKGFTYPNPQLLRATPNRTYLFWRGSARPAPRSRPRRLIWSTNANASRTSGGVWDPALDARRWPVITYARFPSARDHAYWYARWDGRRWLSHFLTFAGPSIRPGTIEQQYSGGMALDHVDPSVEYLSRKRDGLVEIERWSTHNGGYSWRRTTVIRDGRDAVWPVIPEARAAGASPRPG